MNIDNQAHHPVADAPSTRHTILEIPLHHKLILLLVSSTNHKVIFTANEPEEFFKPEEEALILLHWLMD